MIKVYATMEVKNNLITTIPFKGVQVRVEFTGGNSMKNIPAKYYTRDPFTQKALDSSDQLGRLYYVHQVIKEEGDDKPKQAAVQQPAAPAADATGTVATGKAPAPENPEPPAQEPTPENPNPEVPENPDAGEGAEDAGDSDGSATAEKLEFENLAEAVNYIATKYGEQVESESQVRKFIEEKEGKKCLIHKG